MTDEPGRDLRGVVSPDPLTLMPIGSSIPVRPVMFGSSDGGSIPLGVSNWTFFDGALLALGFRGAAGGAEILGSAVMIAPGLALTATHVLTNHLPQLTDGSVVGICMGPREGGLDLWKLRSISYDEADDLAFLSLELMSPIGDDWSFRTLPLTTRCPAVGETVTITGFRFAEGWPWPEGGAPLPAVGELFASTGAVSVVYHPRRDTSVITYPAIEISCGSLGAMSGGAVLDRDGCLLGVISRGWNTEDGEGPSYAAWIVSGALGRSLDVPWPPGAYPSPVTVTSIPDSALRIIGRDALTVNGTSVAYKVWF